MSYLRRPDYIPVTQYDPVRRVSKFPYMHQPVQKRITEAMDPRRRNATAGHVGHSFDHSDREGFTRQPHAIRMPECDRVGGKSCTLPDYDQLYQELYGLPNAETFPYQNPDCQYVDSTGEGYTEELAKAVWSYETSAPADAKIARTMHHMGQKAQASLVFRSAMGRNPAQKYFAEELEDGEHRQWWDQDDKLDDTLYQHMVRGIMDRMYPYEYEDA